jgi:glycosyltransferase involved in cell wall biosynthesis
MFYLDQVLANAPQARLVFDSMDAEHVRLVRRTKTLPGGIESDVFNVRLRERLMVSVADVVVAVTEQDLRALMELEPATLARGLVIPNLYDLTRERAPHHGQEWDAVFVGGFVHEPNVDAIRWLAEEICPLLSTRIRIRIVGHGLPTPFATMARAAGMTYLGEVDDLSHIYASTKFAIAPLRFGSGVKGKVIEAALHGLPVVGTPLAWEGIQVEDDVSGVVAETAREFADAMQRLTVNPVLRNNLAQASLDWLTSFGVDAHRDAVVAAVRDGS